MSNLEASTHTELDLHITLVGASRLQAWSLSSAPSPYATVTFCTNFPPTMTELFRTRADKNTFGPRWNKEFRLRIHRGQPNSLQIEVLDKKLPPEDKNRPLGVAFLPVNIPPWPYRYANLPLYSTKSYNTYTSVGSVTLDICPCGDPSLLTMQFEFLNVTESDVAARLPQSEQSAKPIVNHGQSSASSSRAVAASIAKISIEKSGKESSSCQTESSNEATSAWNKKFGTPQIRLGRNDPSPFLATRRLGGGGVGIVYETSLDGITLALKRTYARKLSDEHLNEVKILSRITKRRHRHIVELIGSYIHQQQSSHELGLLIWPVARCDLATFLQDVEFLGQWIIQAYSEPNVPMDWDISVMETLSAITGFRHPWTRSSELRHDMKLCYLSRKLLHSRLSCISNAVAWLHQEGIRHKDLKPSQILLAYDGLWLTDFGWSKDISESALSTTSEGDNITLKYQSPERAQKNPCGRSEDIFALGCIFREMAFQLVRDLSHSQGFKAPWHSKGWYFHAHIDVLQKDSKILSHNLLLVGYEFELGELIAKMLKARPDQRPTIKQVIKQLHRCGSYGECCAPSNG